jgi:hypothetical protein
VPLIPIFFPGGNPVKFLLFLLCLLLAAGSAAASMQVTINPITGGVSLNTDAAISIEAYEITAPQAGDWDFSNGRWTSLVDQSLVTGWFELGGGDLLAEALFVGSPLSLPAGATLLLGSPYIGSTAATSDDFSFRFKTFGQAFAFGTVTVVPEPISGLMTASLVVGCLRRRRRGS